MPSTADEVVDVKEEFDSPLPPFKRRKTEVVHHADICSGLWTFNQPWTPVPFNNTSAGIRMIVFKLDDGSLWVRIVCMQLCSSLILIC